MYVNEHINTHTHTSTHAHMYVCMFHLSSKKLQLMNEIRYFHDTD